MQFVHCLKLVVGVENSIEADLESAKNQNKLSELLVIQFSHLSCVSLPCDKKRWYQLRPSWATWIMPKEKTITNDIFHHQE
jgi:hypothetical protein